MTAKTAKTATKPPDAEQDRRGPYQLFGPLPDAEFEALKADIRKHGILVPVEYDEVGEILDGHHRVRAWLELREEGCEVADFPRITRLLGTEGAKRNHVRALNTLRRHLGKPERDEQIRAMHQDGASTREIAGKLGVSHQTVMRAVNSSGGPDGPPTPDRVLGKDGKSYPATRPAPAVFSASEAEHHRAIDALDEAKNQELPAEVMSLKAVQKIADAAVTQRMLDEANESRESGKCASDIPGVSFEGFDVGIEEARTKIKIRRLFHHWPPNARPMIAPVLSALSKEDFLKW